MQIKRLLSILFIVALVTTCTGCYPEVTLTTPEGETTTTTVESVSFKLFRLEVQFDEEGVPSIWGVRATDIGYWLGLDTSAIILPEYYINWLMDSNLQHLELCYTGSGIALYANAKPLPYLTWDPQSLDNAGQLLETLQVPYAPLIRRLLPILQFLGFDIVFKFPLREGVEPIPPRTEVAAPEPPKAKPPTLAAYLEVSYDEEGIPSIFGLSAKDLQALTGMDLTTLYMDKATLDLLTSSNIQHIALETVPDGLFVYVNGMNLPHLAWNDETLANVADLYEQMNPDSPFTQFMRQIISLLAGSDVNLIVRFPLQPGTEPIPLPERVRGGE